MEIGVRIPHTGPQADPAFVREWCTTADQAGYGILWGIDHLVMPQKVESKYVLPRKPATIADDAVADQLSPNFEMMTTLAYAAAVTERARLGTAIAVLTIRNAVLNARQLATLDRYSNGRLVYGVGIGWLKEGPTP
jgi:alkanesulfonate monooxygenase SsuD/methylene tetrahydromethanopterin reductase-like flavin-dependent oxidoreductase (luciferase family)